MWSHVAMMMIRPHAAKFKLMSRAKIRARNPRDGPHSDNRAVQYKKLIKMDTPSTDATLSTLFFSANHEFTAP